MYLMFFILLWALLASEVRSVSMQHSVTCENSSRKLKEKKVACRAVDTRDGEQSLLHMSRRDRRSSQEHINTSSCSFSNNPGDQMFYLRPEVLTAVSVVIFRVVTLVTTQKKCTHRLEVLCLVMYSLCNKTRGDAKVQPGVIILIFRNFNVFVLTFITIMYATWVFNKDFEVI